MKNNEQHPVGKFVIEILLCVIIIADICACILVASRDTTSYGAASIGKRERLSDAPTPRLILEGGSGIAFGIDSAAIEKQTGLHPVNLGLYAGFGMDFMDAQAQSGARPGDILLIVPEYEFLDAPPSAQGFIVLEAVQEDPTFIRFAWSNPYTLIDILRQFPGWFSTRIVSLIGKTPLGKPFVQENSLYHRVYRASSFNSNGDMVGHLSETSSLGAAAIASSSVLTADAANADTLKSLKTFIDFEEKKGVTVLVSWPPVPKSLYEKYKGAILEQDSQLVETVGSQRVLGTQADFTFNEDDFFDSIGHLDAAGREIRTQRLVTLIKQWLANDLGNF
jgi:hypothetical protein